MDVLRYAVAGKLQLGWGGPREGRVKKVYI
jgi:hypothetical protein